MFQKMEHEQINRYKVENMKRFTMLLLAVLVPLSGLAEDHESVDKQIRQMEARFNGAYAENDLRTYFGNYTEDATLIFYGARQPLTNYKKELHTMIDSGGGMEKNDMTDLKIQVMPGGHVAVATYRLSSVTRNPNGKKQATSAFETDVWQKIDDNWKIISMHYSEIPPVE